MLRFNRKNREEILENNHGAPFRFSKKYVIFAGERQSRSVQPSKSLPVIAPDAFFLPFVTISHNIPACFHWVSTTLPYPL